MIYWKIWLPFTDHMTVLIENLHPPLLEKKIASCYQKPHIKKTLTTAFMKRSKFKNKANNTKNLMTQTNINSYKKQHNYIMHLNKKTKLEYVNNFDSSQGSISLWVKCKTYFSNKHIKADTDIILNEKCDIFFKNKEISDSFNE